LVSSGGHIVEFEGKKIFPVKFVMKHYPIRGKEHGTKKIFADRLPRYDKNERDMHWHTQYDRYLVEDEIKFSKKDLLEYNGNIVKQIYLPLLNCLSIQEEKDRIIKEKDQLITSIYFSRSWKIGRFLTTPWRWMKKILLRKK
jgi:hypothetical protein